MGDTVLFEDEVNPVMSVALDNGLSVTALHNHFFFDHPKVYFMHIEGQGTVEQLAGAVRKVYDKIKEIRAANPQPKDSFGGTALPEKNSISAEPLNKIFGMSGETNNGMVKFTIGHPATMHGVKIGNAMGVNTWMAFAGSDDNAVVDGDFAVSEDELQSALKAIRAWRDQHRRDPFTHDARAAAHFVFPLLGQRPGQRIGGSNSRCASGRRLVRSKHDGGEVKRRHHAIRSEISLTQVKHFILAIVIAVAGSCLAVAEAGDAAIQLKQTIPLPGVEGRIDHFDVDTSRRKVICLRAGQ